MTRALSKSMMENERIRLTPDYAYINSFPNFNDLLLGKFTEKITSDPAWFPFLAWLAIVENGKQHRGTEPTAYEVMRASTDRPPRVGEHMTKWFKSLLPKNVIMTNTLTDQEGWSLLTQLMFHREKHHPEERQYAGYSIPITVALRRPLNEKELLKKIDEQGGLGITYSKTRDHIIVLLTSTGIPYRYEVQERQDAFNATSFEIAGLLKVF